ncbi:MAG: MFS transporter, partial [Pseudomonadota bacterium]
YSLAGFAGGMLGPSVFGLALDLAGGKDSMAAWAWAYGAIGAGCLAAPLVVLALGRARPAR